MPAIRRIGKRHRDELTRCQRAHLKTGWFVVGPAESSSRYETLADFRAAWWQHRDELMEGCVGWRPLAWWICEHGKELPLNEAGREMEASIGLDRMRADDRYRRMFGFLHRLEWQVDETTYLRENGLLAAGEAEAIAERLADE